MTKLSIDNERLAVNLEKGIGYVDKRFGAIGWPEKYRLRVPYCGLTSVATHEYFKSLRVPSTVLYGKIDTGVGEEIEHCVNQIDLDGNRYVIDCTYSQFLNLAGLIPGHAMLIGNEVYPDARVEVFYPEESHNVADKLAKAAFKFQNYNKHPASKFGNDLGDGPLSDATYETSLSVYEKIFDLSLYAPKVDFHETTLKAGLALSCFIGKRAVQFTY
ncbi:MAG TPA: hypothetical protein VMR51_01385 [Patescibacteria group bacterium]|nr:hypothetical protein [Patescibacteria group bacterium]